MPCATGEQICLAESLVFLLSFAQGFWPRRRRSKTSQWALIHNCSFFYGKLLSHFLKSKHIREAGRMMNWVCLCVSRHPPEPGNVHDWIDVYSPSHMLGRVLFLACYRNNPLADSETKVTIKQSY